MKTYTTNRTNKRVPLLAATLMLLSVAGTSARANNQDHKAPCPPNCDATENSLQQMLHLQRRLEHMGGSPFQNGFVSYEPTSNAAQPMDLRERPDAFIVQMDLPGMTKADIKVEVKDRLLSISGSPDPQVEPQPDEEILLQERNLNEFSRGLILPDRVNAADVTADYTAGVLTVTLQKSVKDQPVHTVTIQ